MVDHQGSAQLGTLLASFGTAGIFIAALITAFRSSRQHEQANQEFAQAQGIRPRTTG